MSFICVDNFEFSDFFLNQGERRSKPDFRGYDQHGMLNENILKTGNKTLHYDLQYLWSYDVQQYKKIISRYHDVQNISPNDESLGKETSFENESVEYGRIWVFDVM